MKNINEEELEGKMKSWDRNELKDEGTGWDDGKGEMEKGKN